MKHLLLFVFSLASLIGFSQTSITATIPYQGYDETQAFLGQGEYQIFMDTTDGVLDKPVILVDGFDPGDTRDIAGMYSSLDYDATNIADQLRAEGFDVVLLNFPTYTRASDNIEVNGGVDYIQRNAMVLVELINQINSQKTGSQELVVVGPSMGGLISRYALRYMEQNSLTHETRLFVSWDTPHKGANIPMNLQYLMNYFAEGINGGNADLQATVASTLGSPASKEMLIDQYSAHLQNGSTYLQDSNILLPTGATNFRDAFQAEIDAMGFPQQTRNISIANGSSNGTMIGTPGMEILNHTFDLSDVAQDTTMDIILHFTPPANQTIEVTRATIINTTLGFPVTVDDFGASSQSFSYTDGLDSAPGGKYDLQDFLGNVQGNAVVTELLANLQQSEFCFIPMLSAMAIDNENDWYASFDSNTQNTPFDAYFLPTVNEDHVTPTIANVAFALDEIRVGVVAVSQNNFDTLFQLKSNPVVTELVILNKQHIPLIDVSIYAITGQQVVHKSVVNSGGQFNLPIELSNGVYFLKVTVDGAVYMKKFIVKK